MSKKEEFKEFAKKHPELVSHIKSGNATWQNFYEIYDIYGDANDAWSNYINNNKKNESINLESESNNKISSLNDLTKVFKNADVKNIQKHIGTAQKAIGLFQELTTKSTTGGALGALGSLAAKPTATRPLNKFFED